MMFLLKRSNSALLMLWFMVIFAPVPSTHGIKCYECIWWSCSGLGVEVDCNKWIVFGITFPSVFSYNKCFKKAGFDFHNERWITLSKGCIGSSLSNLLEETEKSKTQVAGTPQTVWSCQEDLCNGATTQNRLSSFPFILILLQIFNQ